MYVSASVFVAAATSVSVSVSVPVSVWSAERRFMAKTPAPLLDRQLSRLVPLTFQCVSGIVKCFHFKKDTFTAV